MLNRLGNKSQLAKDIQSYFPSHACYIELFFGAGGMFFNKPAAKNSILNDLDNDVYNFWTVLRNSPKELKQEITLLPIHNNIWKEYKGKDIQDPVLKAALFLMYSNFGYMGKSDTLHTQQNTKKIILEKFEKTVKQIENCLFMKEDFRDVLGKISFRKDSKSTFIYADPPYLETAQYEVKFTKKDTTDLFSLLVKSGIKFAISEFNHPFILKLAKKHKLNVIVIGERQTLKNRNTEILITNY
jgi:DNA adenine methylase